MPLQVTLGSVETALGHALALLARRAYTEKALREKLLARFGQAEVEEALRRLKDYGYLDDRAFARAFVEARKKYGPLKLKALLRARGVPEEVVQEAVPEAGPEEALAVLRKYPHRRDKPRAVRFLQGRGFPLGVALEAYRRLAEEEKEG
ncbi:recombinase RecX [Thermus filiformis]|jgi:regulatory protein|uniref:Regulatory protein RecX n=1 Tax=Thermus filiformis TaxID=276 RepID=A0A0D6X9F2_THEFI|nr:regulatory protein RecX [Thermus filiformis]KIX84524.1 recombinase RecX [Thermus filiformis]